LLETAGKEVVIVVVAVVVVGSKGTSTGDDDMGMELLLLLLLLFGPSSCLGLFLVILCFFRIALMMIAQRSTKRSIMIKKHRTLFCAKNRGA
jgi:hypothetical protein